MLVGPITDPGWMPLFVGAVAVVAEMGGELSHTMIVSRPRYPRRRRRGRRHHRDQDRRSDRGRRVTRGSCDPRAGMTSPRRRPAGVSCSSNDVCVGGLQSALVPGLRVGWRPPASAVASRLGPSLGRSFPWRSDVWSLAVGCGRRGGAELVGGGAVLTASAAGPATASSFVPITPCRFRHPLRSRQHRATSDADRAERGLRHAGVGLKRELHDPDCSATGVSISVAIINPSSARS